MGETHLFLKPETAWVSSLPTAVEREREIEEWERGRPRPPLHLSCAVVASVSAVHVLYRRSCVFQSRHPPPLFPFPFPLSFPRLHLSPSFCIRSRVLQQRKKKRCAVSPFVPTSSLFSVCMDPALSSLFFFHPPTTTPVWKLGGLHRKRGEEKAVGVVALFSLFPSLLLFGAA